MKVGLTATVLSFFLLVGCKSSEEEIQTSSKKYVKIETVALSNSNSTLIFNGKIKEKSLIDLSFRVGGPLINFNVNTGDYVQKGQLIAEIDKRDYEIQLQTRKAQLQQIEGEYNRYKTLFAEGKLPENTMEKMESGYLMAKAGYESALNQLEDTELRTPISGYVHAKKTESFQTVGPGMPIVSIIDLSSLEVEISVPENQIANIQNSLKNLLKVENAGISNLPVKLSSVGEKTEMNGMYKVVFSVENRNDTKIYPGMTAEVSMLFGNNNQTISIPSSAVFNSNNSDCVWIYDPSSKSVSMREVQISKFSSNGKVEIVSGIKIGDQIVTAGVNNINEGQNVEPIANPSETNIGGLL